jgi:hypothetical protein
MYSGRLSAARCYLFEMDDSVLHIQKCKKANVAEITA